LDPAVVRELDVTLDNAKLIQALADLCPPALTWTSQSARSERHFSV
jgi:hypothetical protein